MLFDHTYYTDTLKSAKCRILNLFPVFENIMVKHGLLCLISLLLKPWTNGPASSRKWTQVELV